MPIILPFSFDLEQPINGVYPLSIPLQQMYNHPNNLSILHLIILQVSILMFTIIPMPQRVLPRPIDQKLLTMPINMLELLI